MWPWEVEPKSIATGILDDETYDWWSLLAATLESGGWPVTVDDATIDATWRDALERTHLCVSPTGVAGLAGVRALARDGALAPHENVLVLFTGVR
jgi:threonine synthase